MGPPQQVCQHLSANLQAYYFLSLSWYLEASRVESNCCIQSAESGFWLLLEA